MAAPHPEHDEVRRRIASWLRYFFRKYGHQYPTRDTFATALGLKTPTVVNIMNNKRTPGLDVLLCMRRAFHISLDLIVDTNPPEHDNLW